MATNNEITFHPSAARTEEDIIEAMRELATVSYETVGADKTYTSLKFLANIVRQSPEVYQKITDPETVERLKNLIEKHKSGKMNMLEIMSAVSEITSILA